MKFKKNLDIGDWIVSGDKGTIKSGKFKIARVKGILFDNWEEIDLDKREVRSLGKEAESTTAGGYWKVLNEREMKKLHILRTKLATLNALDDEEVIKRR